MAVSHFIAQRILLKPFGEKYSPQNRGASVLMIGNFQPLPFSVDKFVLFIFCVGRALCLCPATSGVKPRTQTPPKFRLIEFVYLADESQPQSKQASTRRNRIYWERYIIAVSYIDDVSSRDLTDCQGRSGIR